MTALLKEVVRINSHTANKSGVDTVVAVFKRELQALGMRTTSVAQCDHGHLLLIYTSAVKDTYDPRNYRVYYPLDFKTLAEK